MQSHSNSFSDFQKKKKKDLDYHLHQTIVQQANPTMRSPKKCILPASIPPFYERPLHGQHSPCVSREAQIFSFLF